MREAKRKKTILQDDIKVLEEQTYSAWAVADEAKRKDEIERKKLDETKRQLVENTARLGVLKEELRIVGSAKEDLFQSGFKNPNLEKSSNQNSGLENSDQGKENSDVD